MSCKLLLQKLPILTPRLANSYVQRCQTSVPDIFENSRNTRDKELKTQRRADYLCQISQTELWQRVAKFPDQNLAPEEAFVQIGKKRAIYRVEHRTENFEEKKNYIEINTTAVENTAT